MPKAIINEREVEVSEDAYQRLWDTPQGGVALRFESDGVRKIALYDRTNGTWTQPLPAKFVHDYYLRKVVYRCSSCSFTTSSDGGVETHATRSVEISQGHRGAKLTRQMVGTEPVQACDGCGLTFNTRRRPMQAEKHLESVAQMGKLHQGGTQAIPMMKFALAPSEPPTVSAFVDTIAGGPVTSQVERNGSGRDATRTRRRNRRRR